MRAQDRAEIERLAAVVQEKRDRFRMLAMMNTIGLTPEEARQQTQAFEVARAEMWEAESALSMKQLRGLFASTPHPEEKK